MKVEIEKLLFIVLLVVLFYLTLTLVTPSADNYVLYENAKQIAKTRDILWRYEPDGLPYYFAVLPNQQDYRPVLSYPPLGLIIWAALFSIGSSPIVLDLISIFVVLFLLYKIDKKAVPFMALSFVFIRSSVWGGLDIFMLALATASIYFYKRKPLLSGVFAGLTPLAKTNGFLFLFAWIIAVFYMHRKEIISPNVFKNKYFLSIIIALLVLSPWYFRNFIFFNGNIAATIIGLDPSVALNETWLETGVQANQPERYLFDTAGFYPLPIDLLFYIGLALTIYALVKKEQGTQETNTDANQPKSAATFKINLSFDFEQTMIFVLAFLYFFFQIINFANMMPIRYYIPILPLVALQISKGIKKENYLRVAYVVSLIALVYFASNMPKYAFNAIDAQMPNYCSQITDAIDYEPVLVNAYHQWYVIYRCDLNATIKERSKWTLDFEEGRIYPTNQTI